MKNASKPSKVAAPSPVSKSAPANNNKQANNGKPTITKPTVIGNTAQKKNKPADQAPVIKPLTNEPQKRSIDNVEKSGPQAKKQKNEVPATLKKDANGAKNGAKGKKVEDDDDDDDDEVSGSILYIL